MTVHRGESHVDPTIGPTTMDGHNASDAARLTEAFLFKYYLKIFVRNIDLASYTYYMFCFWSAMSRQILSLL